MKCGICHKEKENFGGRSDPCRECYKEMRGLYICYICSIVAPMSWTICGDCKVENPHEL